MIGPAVAGDRDRVGPYRLIKAIGAGGSARIDLARLDRVYGFQRHVVIKRPLEHLREDPAAAAQIRREARIGGLLCHPNLVAVLDAGQHDGYDYLALEYVHGAPLRALMQTDAGPRVRDVPPAVALAIVAGVARALHHAHELTDDDGAPLGLVHRDVSPGNVLLALDGAVKLADFGIAKETRVQTLSGSMHGTVRYMAPEQCRGHAYDRRADVFSLGVICYELVTGARLFWADNDVASLHRMLSGDVPRPRDVRPSVPPALEALVMTAIAHEPERRFPTARAFAEAIEGYAAHAGLALAPRWIARWVEEVLGRREAPWSAGIAATAPAQVPAEAPPEASLIELIAAVPDEAPPDAMFGPSAERSESLSGGSPELGGIDPAPARADQLRATAEITSHRLPAAPRAPRRRRLAIGAMIVAGVAGGTLGAIAVLDRPKAPAPAQVAPSSPSIAAPAPAPSPEPAPPPAPTPAPAPAPVATSEEASPPSPSPPPDHGYRPSSRRKRPPAPAPAATAGTAAARSAAEPRPGESQPSSASPPAPSPVAAEADGSAGSAAPAPRSPRTNAKWSPSLMLPSDSGSGSGTRR